MAERFQKRALRSPRSIGVMRSFYYPGEVVRLLRLESVDYRQLRRLFRLAVVGSGGEEVGSRSWSRFGFLEILAARIAVGLARSSTSSRLRLAQVERACAVLRERYGVRRALLDVQLKRVGDSIVAEFSSVQLEPTSGQLLIPEVVEFVSRYAQDRGEKLQLPSGFLPEKRVLQVPVEVVVA